TKALTPYRPEFLAGWRAEAYALDLMPAWDIGQTKMAHEQQSRCARDVPGDTHQNLQVHNNFAHVTFKHVLLPIWVAAYRYQDKPYQFLVNGQTGEVVGKAPYSIIKIVLFILFILAVIAGIAVATGSKKASRSRVSQIDSTMFVLASAAGRCTLAGHVAT
ncbi:MAG TPA: hypothetical protein PKA58_31715, partial [Polyangium sp.]|nr:hypothetical protein [Polyangium sp.]